MNILTIGGSDPSSGAGIQSDIKAAHALGANCFSVITAITAQNSKRFYVSDSIPPCTIQAQIDSVFSDFEIDVVILGMLYDSTTISTVHNFLQDKKIPILTDPVIESTTGGILLKKSALSTFKKLIIPISRIITPNIREAEIISGVKIKKQQDLLKAAESFVGLGAKNIVITGHPFIKNKISEFVYEDGKYYSISGKKIPGQNHGSGCNFALALSYYTTQNNSFKESVEFAKKFTYNSIKTAQHLGRGIKITNPSLDRIRFELGNAIQEFQGLKNVHLLIPECQTNFVFAKQGSRSITDIAGIRGRLVKSGNTTIVAGGIEYGGSKHVATAVLMVQRKFPQIRSALNIRFDESLIKRFTKAKNAILSYDRSEEPTNTKARENSSISWGIQSAMEKSDVCPDIIYHKGDLGKEPMIIVFGKDPKDVVEKISKSLTEN